MGAQGGSTGTSGSTGGDSSSKEGMMASMKPEEMHKTIDKAAEAAQPMVERVVSTAHAGVDKLSGLLSGASEQFSNRSAQMNDTYQQLADSGREYVRNKPGTAVAIALGAGYILAKLLGGSRRRDY
jgi:ElaB/YqjD/DUF883 family membrane-anchored ribosome-binding protein